jgi:hypothetical protein
MRLVAFAMVRPTLGGEARAIVAVAGAARSRSSRSTRPLASLLAICWAEGEARVARADARNVAEAFGRGWP